MLTGVWTAFLLESLLSGAAIPHFASWTLLLPTLLLLVLAALDPASKTEA